MNEKKMIMIKKKVYVQVKCFFSEFILLSKLQRNFEISAKY